MYVRSLEIRDLKLIRDMRLDFVREDGSPRMWTVLVGENGLGKTSILRALAVGAVGPERGNQLADIASLADRRKKSAAVSIEAHFDVPQGTDSRALVSQVGLPSDVNLFRGSSRWLDGEQTDNPLGSAQARRDPGLEWFVAGYGVERQLPQPLNSPEVDDRVLARMEPLFDKGPIIATGFADQLEEKLARAYAALLKEALVEFKLLPKVSNLFLGGRGGVTKARTLTEANRFSMRVGGNSIPMPATWLSQGYQAMIAWVADLIGNTVLTAGRALPLDEIRGIVLVDELDLFVHPLWQIDLIPKLKRIFPRVQFVVTTHSPMVLPGLDQEEVFILGQDQVGSITARPAPSSPKLMSGSEIYDLFFGIHELYPTEAARALRTYTQYAADPQRTEDEEERLRQAEDVLKREGVALVPAVERGEPQR